jgi:hypothetical protein
MPAAVYLGCGFALGSYTQQAEHAELLQVDEDNFFKVDRTHEMISTS